MNTHVLLTTALYIAPACVVASDEVTLTVVISDYVGVPRELRDSALRVTQRVFRHACIEARWRICNDSVNALCDIALPPRRTYVQLKIVRASIGCAYDKAEALGWAPIADASGGRTVYVFYGPLTKLARDTGQIVSDVLADVMIHELAHTLGLQHGRFGIMRESLCFIDPGPVLWFTAAENKQLHDGALRLSAILNASAN